VNVGWFKGLGGARVINKPGAVSISSNKLKARAIFKNEGVPAPRLWLGANTIPDAAFPVIARTTHHMKGRGFWFCKNKTEALRAASAQKKLIKKLITTKKGKRVWRMREANSSSASHFIDFIPNTREFRVHIMASKMDLKGACADDYAVLKTSEKFSSKPKANEVIKNHRNGWVFGYPKNRKDPILEEVRQAAKLAVCKLGLHWGAVDIITSKNDNKVYVLEVNSAPGMTGEHADTIEKYIHGFSALMGFAPPLVTKVSLQKVEKRKTARRKKLNQFLNKQYF